VEVNIDQQSPPPFRRHVTAWFRDYPGARHRDLVTDTGWESIISASFRFPPRKSGNRGDCEYALSLDRLH
jgi:hypothetical protein